MADSFDKLRKRVMAELKKQQTRPDENLAAAERMKRFGAFVEACLSNSVRSRADFAKQLDLEPELADAILDGLLPESEIDDVLLADIAQVIQYEPNVLRVMLGRSPHPARDDQPSRKHRPSR